MVKLIPAWIAATLLVGACATVPQTTSDAGSRSASESSETLTSTPVPNTTTPPGPGTNTISLDASRVVDDAIVAPAVDGVRHVMRLPELHSRPEQTLPQVTPPRNGERTATTRISFPRFSEPEHLPTIPPSSAAASVSDPAEVPATPVVQHSSLHEPAIPTARPAQSPAQPRAAQPDVERRPASPPAAGLRPAASPPEGLPPRVAPAASASAPPPPASAAPAPVDRTIFSTVGEETVVRLEGENWLFLGSAPGGVVYRRRRLLDGATELVLRPDQAGEYRLDFQRQDLLQGEREELAVMLNVSDRRNQRGAAASGSGAAGRVGSSLEPGIGDAVGLDEAMVSAEPPFDPIAEAIASIETDDPAAIATAASTAREAGNRDLATALWRRNRNLETQHGREARVGLFELSVSAGRFVDAVSYADLMAEHREAPPTASLIVLTDALISAGDGSTAATAIERALALRTDPSADDELLFRLARHYETDRVERNLRRSLGYYRRIAAEFPLSRHWEASRARIEHIERHFFHVR